MEERGLRDGGQTFGSESEGRIVVGVSTADGAVEQRGMFEGIGETGCAEEEALTGAAYDEEVGGKEILLARRAAERRRFSRRRLRILRRRLEWAESNLFGFVMQSAIIGSEDRLIGGGFAGMFRKGGVLEVVLRNEKAGRRRGLQMAFCNGPLRRWRVSPSRMTAISSSGMIGRPESKKWYSSFSGRHSRGRID